MVGHQAPNCTAGHHAMSQKNGDLYLRIRPTVGFSMRDPVEGEDITVFTYNFMFFHRVTIRSDKLGLEDEMKIFDPVKCHF